MSDITTVVKQTILKQGESLSDLNGLHIGIQAPYKSIFSIDGKPFQIGKNEILEFDNINIEIITALSLNGYAIIDQIDTGTNIISQFLLDVSEISDIL